MGEAAGDDDLRESPLFAGLQVGAATGKLPLSPECSKELGPNNVGQYLNFIRERERYNRGNRY